MFRRSCSLRSNSFDLLSKAQRGRLSVFPYSPPPGTSSKVSRARLGVSVHVEASSYYSSSSKCSSSDVSLISGISHCGPQFLKSPTPFSSLWEYQQELHPTPLRHGQYLGPSYQSDHSVRCRFQHRSELETFAEPVLTQVLQSFGNNSFSHCICQERSQIMKEREVMTRARERRVIRSWGSCCRRKAGSALHEVLM